VSAGGEGPQIAPAGDQAVRVRFPRGPRALDDVARALAALDAAPLAGVTDLVPAFASITAAYDPLRVAPAEVAAWLARGCAAAPVGGPRPRRRLEIPVLYDEAEAPDLAPLAAEKGLSVARFVALHTAPAYRCAMLGFRPGFPFLSGLDPALAAPRLPTPRTTVPAGAVGIGGAQTGIYPSAGPGGWRLVGRTPLRLFDPGRAAPFLVEPGDEVRLVPIDRARFAALAAGEGGRA
jgi:KipI family sensor histidine kinase inhibitor